MLYYPQGLLFLKETATIIETMEQAHWSMAEAMETVSAFQKDALLGRWDSGRAGKEEKIEMYCLLASIYRNSLVIHMSMKTGYLAWNGLFIGITGK